MESDEVTLEDSIKLYEEGIQLMDFCQKKLDEAEKTVKKLSRDSEGEFHTSSLDSPLQDDDK